MKLLNLTEDQIIKTMSKLENLKLTDSSHLFMRYPNSTIGEAVREISDIYSKEAKEKPGLVLLSVILAAHRNYTKQVEPQINRLRKLTFHSFGDLKSKTLDFEEFSVFIGMREFGKYQIIKELLETIDSLKIQYKIYGDYEIMNCWALKADYLNHSTDVIGRIKGIGVATFQHLRMNFGAGTVKPDQRVKEVLNREFALNSNSDMQAIAAVEYIARIIGRKVIYVDQVLVNYGSGYYTEKVTEEVQKTAVEVVTEHKSNKKLEVGEMGVNTKIDNMFKYVIDAVEKLDVHMERRNDGAYIIVADKFSYRSTGKNVATLWLSNASVSVRVINRINKRTPFYSLEEMMKASVAENIVGKYYEMVEGV